MSKTLVERLRECLPTTADGLDAETWCSVRGDDLREAVVALQDADALRAVSARAA